MKRYELTEKGVEFLEELPDVPTLKDLGQDAYFANWRGFFAAPGLPDGKAQAYGVVLGKMYETKEWEAVRARNGWANLYKPGAEFVAFLEAQEQTMGDLMRKLGVLR